MAEYLSSKNLAEAVNGVRDMKAPKHFLPEMLSKIIVCSLDRPDEDKEHVSTLIHTLRAESLITGENFMQVDFHPSIQTAVSTWVKRPAACPRCRLSSTSWTSALRSSRTCPWSNPTWPSLQLVPSSPSW